MSAALRLRAQADDGAGRESDAAFVLSLRARGVFDRAVLGAMERVPREVFAPRRYADLARSDVALPLACGQTMTSPTVVAAMLAALDLRPGHRVLEIGTGSGYVTALMCRMGARVHSVERRATLAESASHRLASAGFGADLSLVCGDGFSETPELHYDRVILNGAVRRLTAALTSSLRAGGRLVAAMAGDTGPRLFTMSRSEDGPLVHTLGTHVRISPLVTSDR